MFPNEVGQWVLAHDYQERLKLAEQGRLSEAASAGEPAGRLAHLREALRRQACRLSFLQGKVLCSLPECA